MRGEKSSTGGLVRQGTFPRWGIVESSFDRPSPCPRYCRCRESRRRKNVDESMGCLLPQRVPTKYATLLCMCCSMRSASFSGLRSYSCRLISRTAWHTYDTRAVARCLVSFASSLLFLFSCSLICWSCLNAIRHHFRLCCPSEGDPLLQVRKAEADNIVAASKAIAWVFGCPDGGRWA